MRRRSRARDYGKVQPSHPHCTRKRGNSCIGNPSAYGKSKLQPIVRQIPTMMVSFHRVSGVPSAEMMKLAKADSTRPSGRIVTANERMDNETNKIGRAS